MSSSSSKFIFVRRRRHLIRTDLKTTKLFWMDGQPNTICISSKMIWGTYFFGSGAWEMDFRRRKINKRIYQTYQTSNSRYQTDIPFISRQICTLNLQACSNLEDEMVWNHIIIDIYLILT